MLSNLDIGIIVAYFVITISIGLFFAKRASESIDSYFLGGRKLPWFLLGMSGVATYLDMSGTMMQTSFFHVLGAKGFWVCFRGAIALPLAFQMIFIAKWLRRTRVMTNAELLSMRFGKSTQGQMAEVLSVISVLMMAVAGVMFFYVGTEKFLGTYITAIPPVYSTLIFFSIVLVYVTASGFIGVVYTDLLQAVLVIGVMIFIFFKAMTLGTPEYFAQYTTPEWRSLMPPWEMDMSAFPESYANMRFFIPLIFVWVLMNIFQGFGMPFDAQTSQRMYAAKDEREGALLSLQWILLMGFRFFLMMGIGVISLSLVHKMDDPEQVLPTVIGEFLPTGIRGMFIAALLAAAMSTIDSNLNSGGAYFVKDIYLKYLNPKASSKNLVRVSYITTVVITVIGILAAQRAESVNEIAGWTMMGLFAGVFAPNILKWFWWRLNGAGFAGGMAFGMAAAIINGAVFTNPPEYVTFFFVIAMSLTGTIIGTFLGKPADMDTLVSFYSCVRPFGFWGPVRAQCLPELVQEIKQENRRDQWLLTPACLFQVIFLWLPTAIVLKKWDHVLVCLAIEIVLAFILYKFWYKNLKKAA